MSQLKITDAITGNVVYTCEVSLNIQLDVAESDRANITQLIADPQLIKIDIVGNSMPSNSNTTLLYSEIKLYQHAPGDISGTFGNVIINSI